MRMIQERQSRILLLGANGMLGSTLKPYLKSCGYIVLSHSRVGNTDYCADVSDVWHVFDMLDASRPDLIINLTGLTDVERCESHPHNAYLSNTRPVENIVNWIKTTGAATHLVHISTDQVYDNFGEQSEENICLTNYYAFSKYAGELAAAQIHSTILRTNFFGLSQSSKRISLSDWLYQALLNKTKIQVFEDVWFSPLSMPTLAKMVDLVVRQQPIGVFNLGSHDGMSKADFAYQLAKNLDMSSENMTRTSTVEVDFLKAYRPKDMRMNCTKFENTLAVTLPSLIDEIKLIAGDYNEKI